MSTPDPATRRCPYCAEDIRAEAVKCRYCGSALGEGPLLTRTWYRTRHGRRIAGVCAGLAREFGISVTLIRLAIVLGTLVGGPGLVIYLVLWVVMPREPSVELLPVREVQDP
jgi:phage shock protein PspC (stress-responsive transcriptional regulator)